VTFTTSYFCGIISYGKEKIAPGAGRRKEREGRYVAAVLHLAVGLIIHGHEADKFLPGLKPIPAEQQP
jgi:hypothetical protein